MFKTKFEKTLLAMVIVGIAIMLLSDILSPKYIIMEEIWNIRIPPNDVLDETVRVSETPVQETMPTATENVPEKESNPLNDEMTFDINSFKTIKINTYNTDVRVEPSDGEHVTLFTMGGLQKITKAEVLENELIIVVEKDFKNNMLDGADDSFLRLLVPIRSDKKIEIMADTGDIELSDISLGMIDVKTDSGDVAVNNNVAENLKIKTGSGDIQLNFGAIGQGEFITTSGNVNMQSDEMKNLKAESGSGLVRVQVERIEEVDAKTNSGEIEIVATYIRDLEVDSLSGGIKVESGNIGELDLENGSGLINVMVPYGIDSFEIKSESGDVTIFADSLQKGRIMANSSDVQIKGVRRDIKVDTFTNSGKIIVHGIEYEKEFLKGGADLIKVKTVSGDIDIDE